MDERMSAFERYERGLVLKQVQIYDSALEDFRQAAKDPQYAGKAHVQMALCFRSTGRYDEAIAAFRHALQAPTFSPQERLYVLYLLGQTFEALGRYADSLEAYGWIRKEDPGFRDVAQRIKHLTSKGEDPQRQGTLQGWMDEARTLGRHLKPHVASSLEQTWKSLGRYAETLKNQRWFENTSSGSSEAACQTAHRALTPSRRSEPASRDRTIEARRHVRVPIRLRSQFSSKGRTVTGEGELRDLSPWGCRLTSPVAVPVGTDLECCIFPQDAGNPFVIDGATVRWIGPREFGLSFTNVRPGVQRQIAQLCRSRAALA